MATGQDYKKPEKIKDVRWTWQINGKEAIVTLKFDAIKPRSGRPEAESYEVHIQRESGHKIYKFPPLEFHAYTAPRIGECTVECSVNYVPSADVKPVIQLWSKAGDAYSQKWTNGDSPWGEPTEATYGGGGTAPAAPAAAGGDDGNAGDAFEALQIEMLAGDQHPQVVQVDAFDADGPTLFFDQKDRVWQRWRQGLQAKDFKKFTDVEVPGMTLTESFWTRTSMTRVEAKWEALEIFTRNPPPPPGPPEIYLVQSGGTYDFTLPGRDQEKCISAKIGATTVGVVTRINQLQTGNPEIIQQLHKVRTGGKDSDKDLFEAEAALHQQYKDFGGPKAGKALRKKLGLAPGATEWFVFPVKMVHKIKSQMNNWGVEDAGGSSSSASAQKKQKMSH